MKKTIMPVDQALEIPYPGPLSGEPFEQLPSTLIPSHATLHGKCVELVAQDARRHAADQYVAGHQ